MTLEEHFGLTTIPFPKAAPDNALLRHPSFVEGVERIRLAASRDAIAAVVAESGGGKSTLLRMFAKSLDAGAFNVVSTALTTIGPFGLISQLGALCGLRPARFKGDTAANLLNHLRGLAKRTVLIIDEAHLLPDQSLEDLRLLTASDLDRKSPFALVLAGQPLLRERLAEPQLQALAQRVSVRVRLRPLSETELPAFLDRHLKVAGAKRQIFEADAVAAIFQQTRGVPRPVQNLALAAMINAMAGGKKMVDVAAVQQATLDLDAA